MVEFLQTAETIVRDAALCAQANSRRIVAHKPRGDLVTEGDLAVEDYVLSALKTLYPDHCLDSEEAGSQNRGGEYVWILDPIDGTKYYARGVPLYSVSLALQRRGQGILGVVYSWEFDRMYCASAGRGATLNGTAIECSREEQLQRASVCLEIPSRDCPGGDEELDWAMAKMRLLISKAHRVRVLGVSSLGLCFCAAGGFDAYVNLGSGWRDCDIAAGEVILREAGGEFHRVGKHITAGPHGLCEQIGMVLGI